jgi:hypothetical protein
MILICENGQLTRVVKVNGQLFFSSQAMQNDGACNRIWHIIKAYVRVNASPWRPIHISP